MEFIPIASSSAGCAYLLKSEGCAPLLLDAGLPFKRLREASGFAISELAGCLLTHAHGDHSKGVPDLLAAGVEVFASEDTWTELGIFHHRAIRVIPEATFMAGAWTCKGFDAVHDSPGTLGFLIGNPAGERLLYLTDTAYSKFRFDGLTMVAIECNHSMDLIKSNTARGSVGSHRYSRTVTNHMSLERLLKMLEANDLSSVEAIWLLHLSDMNSDEDHFAERVRAATGKPTYIAAKTEVPK